MNRINSRLFIELERISELEKQIHTCNVLQTHTKKCSREIVVKEKQSKIYGILEEENRTVENKLLRIFQNL